MRDGHLIGQATALPALLARPVKSILNAGILLSSASEREYPLPPSEAPKSRSVPVGRRFWSRFHRGDRVLPFVAADREIRLAGLRAFMVDAGADAGADACVFIPMHHVAFGSGFLCRACGRPRGLVVTPTDGVTISAGIDAGQPWRPCHGDNITDTDCRGTTAGAQSLR